MKLVRKNELPLDHIDMHQVRHVCAMHCMEENLIILKGELPEVLSYDWLDPSLSMEVRASGHHSVEPRVWREHLEAVCERVVEKKFEDGSGGGQIYAILPWRAALAFLEPLRLFNAGIKFIHLDVKRQEVGEELAIKSPMPLSEVDKTSLQSLKPEDQVLIADPMLASGSSVIFCIDRLRALGVEKRQITVLTVAAAPEGVFYVLYNYLGVKIITATFHERLDKNAYIIPGMGDAGDKFFSGLEAKYFQAAKDAGAFTSEQWQYLKKLLQKG